MKIYASETSLFIVDKNNKYIYGQVEGILAGVDGATFQEENGMDHYICTLEELLTAFKALQPGEAK